MSKSPKNEPTERAAASTPKLKQESTEPAIKSAARAETAMIEGIIEGSPDAIGVAVLRLACGCRKMAALDKNGEPASKVIIYRDNSLSVCQQCQQDQGAPQRVQESFIHWIEPAPPAAKQWEIRVKVFGTVAH